MGEVVPLRERFPKELYVGPFLAHDQVEVAAGKGVNVTARSPLGPFTHTFTAFETRLCPDLLDHTRIGEADTLRGRVIRGFFWAMRLWPVSRRA